LLQQPSLNKVESTLETNVVPESNVWVIHFFPRLIWLFTAFVMDVPEPQASFGSLVSSTT
jgi:hypothetical protein